MAAAVELPPGYRLYAHESLESTQDEAKRLAREEAPDGTLVTAGRQTAGRGRSSRPWASPPGNLYLSLVLRPDCPAGRGAQLGFVAALALGDVVQALFPAGADIRYKWPNDVLIGGHKLAGILLESSLLPSGGIDWVVLGMGVNVTTHPDDAAFPATDLCAAGAAQAKPAEVLSAFVERFDRLRAIWVRDGFAPVRAEWLARAWRLGGPVSVRTGGETRVDGTFRDLDATGAMLLTLPDGGERVLSYGDVFPSEE